MKISKNKILSMFASLLLLTSVAAFLTISSGSAATPTYAFISAAPDPIGIASAQPLSIICWINVPIGSVGDTIRFHNFSILVTRPDDTTEYLLYDPTKNVDFTVWDTTGSQTAFYTPTQLGVYKLNFTCPAQRVSSTDYLASTAYTTFTCQQEQIPPPIDSYPLPSEYWTRPIEDQNILWYTISSNWYNGAHDRNYAGNLNSRFQEDGIAPGSAHILWANPVQELTTDYIGQSNFVSDHYDTPMFATQIIMYGRVYYPVPSVSNASGYAGWRIVDLRTGAPVFNYTGTDEPSFGAYLNADYYNQHGVLPWGTIFTYNFARGIDAKELTRGSTTQATSLTAANVPRGIEFQVGHGEYIRLGLANIRSAANPMWVVRQWNSSRMWNILTTNPATTNPTNASGTSYFDYYNRPVIDRYGNTVTLGLDSVEVGAAFNMTDYTYTVTQTILLCRNGTLPTQGTNNTNPYTYFAISCINQTVNGRQYSAGEIMWMKNYDSPVTGCTLLPGPIDKGVFTMVIKETGQWFGYSLFNGQKLWETNPQSNDTPYAYTLPTNRTGSTQSTAYGILFSTGDSGILYAYNLTTGDLMWQKEYPVPYTYEVANYPTCIGAISDNKIYLANYLPSKQSSLPSGMMVRCLNVTDGSEIFALPSWGSPGGYAVADGQLVYFNYYDLKVYSIGKGPSALNVTASPKIALSGQQLSITGAITDASPGSKLKGTGAISDKDMSAWMAYKYMGADKPDVTGVDVQLTTLDPNNNWDNIGTATCNSDGIYSVDWTPPVPGTYQILATFTGTESYYPSSAHSTLYVDSATEPTATPTQEPQQPMTQTYIFASTAAIIVTLVICAIALMMVFRKRP